MDVVLIMVKYDVNLKQIWVFLLFYVLLVFLVIKGLQSMASLVEYKIIKYLK